MYSETRASEFAPFQVTSKGRSSKSVYKQQRRRADSVYRQPHPTRVSNCVLHVLPLTTVRTTAGPRNGTNRERVLKKHIFRVYKCDRDF